MTASTPMGHGRRADQARRQRVIAAIQDAARSGNPVSASSIARAASVDRSFLYRHPDLLAQVHAAQTAPAGSTPGAGAVSHASGLGAPADIDELQRKLTRLEQAQADLTAQLEERTEELRAARDANRELTRVLNQRHLHMP